MNIFGNQKGIALVTALMLTLLSLTIISVVLYFVTEGTKLSAGNKRYQNALEASYGGADFILKDLLPDAFSKAGSGLRGALNTDYSGLNMAVLPYIPASASATADSCLTQKLNFPSGKWTSCTNLGTDPKSAPDFQFTLSGSLTQPSYTVYARIIETVPGNSDTGSGGGPANAGVQFVSGGVVSIGGGGSSGGGGSGVITPQSIPYLYRIEIQGERDTNPVERPYLSVLYAY